MLTGVDMDGEKRKEYTKRNARQGKGRTLSLRQVCRAFLFCIFSLFVADGLNGIEAGGFLCRIPAEEHARERTNGETHDDSPRFDGDGPMSQ